MSVDLLGRVGTGLADPVHGTQAAFRVLLDALAYPGRIGALPMVALAGIAPPQGLDGQPLPLGLVSLLLTLLDRDTTVRLHDNWASDPVGHYLRFHTGVRVAVPAAFEVCSAAGLDPARCASFELGSDELPQRGATVVVTVDGFHLATAPRVTLQGPGVETTQVLQVTGPSAAFWAWRRGLQGGYPRGVDLIFLAGRQVLALPRSARILDIR